MLTLQLLQMYQLCISSHLCGLHDIAVYDYRWYVHIAFISFRMVLMYMSFLRSIFCSAHLRIPGGEMHSPWYHFTLQSYCGSFQYSTSSTRRITLSA